MFESPALRVGDSNMLASRERSVFLNEIVGACDYSVPAFNASLIWIRLTFFWLSSFAI